MIRVDGYQLKDWQESPMNWWDRLQYKCGGLWDRLPFGERWLEPQEVMSILASTRLLLTKTPHDPAPQIVGTALSLIEREPNSIYRIGSNELQGLARYLRFDYALFSLVQVFLFEGKRPCAFLVNLFPEEVTGAQRIGVIGGDHGVLNIALARFQKPGDLYGPEPYEGLLRLGLQLNAYLFERASIGEQR